MAALLAAVVLLASPAAAQDAPAPAPAEAVSAPPAAASTPAAPTDFAGLVTSLRDAGFADKEAIVEQLVASGHASARVVLRAFLEDRLVVRAPDQGVFVATSADETLPTADLLDPVTLKPVGSTPRDALTRIGTNNRLRRVLKGLVARTELANADPAVRLNAVTELLRSPDAQTTALLRERIGTEYQARVRREMATGLALADLDGGDKAARLAAIQVLSQRLLPDVLNRLKALVEKAPDGSFVEPDADIRAAAGAAVDRIEQARSIYSGAETLFFGLGLGAVLVLVAIGLAITFGVMGVINMAHGELMMLGAYTTYVVQTLMPNHIGWSIAVAIPAAFLVSGLTGVAHRTLDHPLPLRPPARDAARHVRRQPRAAAGGALDLHGPEPLGGDAGVDERHAAAERRAEPHLQPPLHHRVHDDRVRPAAARAAADAARPRDPRRVAEPADGAGDGHPHARASTR